MTRGPFDRPLELGWLDAVLESWMKLEQASARAAAARAMAREIVVICRTNRDRVERAEALYEQYREVLGHRDRQDVLRLMAETLLYIQVRGRRIKISDDHLNRLLGPRKDG